MAISRQAIAAACLADVERARALLQDGSEPVVYAALLADLAAAPEVARLLAAAPDGETAPNEAQRTAAVWLSLPRPALTALARAIVRAPQP